ncbi:MAG: tetratricopeptide repeat protein [Balneolia bacterium]|nr:tetratricopeptide repeat protein [Balneolia bacterium]
MKNHLSVIPTSVKSDYIDLVITLNKGTRILQDSYIDVVSSIFSSVRIFAFNSCNTCRELPQNVSQFDVSHKKGKAELWNEELSRSGSPWVLFIEEGEEIDFLSLPSESRLTEAEWVPVLVTQPTGEESFKQFCLARLVCRTREKVFSGKNIPDATRFMLKKGITFSDNAVRIFTEQSPFGQIDQFDELSLQSFSPEVYFQLGYKYFNERKYVMAAAQFRHLQKSDELMAGQKLATINALASCHVELFKWDKAVEMAQKSIAAEPKQFMPYLILYKIFELNKQWSASLEILEKYREVLESGSKASIDKFISKQETLFKLGQLAIKTGQRDKALKYYDLYFREKTGDVEPWLTERLLVLSIELKDYVKAILYFEELFGDAATSASETDVQEKMHEHLSMFMVNGWYEYPHGIYQRLYKQDSSNREYQRKLIVTLSKTNQFAEAKKLIANYF